MVVFAYVTSSGDRQEKGGGQKPVQEIPNHLILLEK